MTDKASFSLSRKDLGFTIVELLVVIVVIGVLAAISLISYSGISQRAIIASLHSDLSGAAKQLKMTYTDNGYYPSSIDCSQADSASNKCLKASPNNSYTYYGADDSGDAPDFTLVEVSGNNTCIITSATPPSCGVGKLAITLGLGSANISSHSCVIASDGRAYCWGHNLYYQLGTGSGSNSSSPVAVSTSGLLNNKTIKAISNGYAHTCAIASDNQAYCWGDGINGQLGNNWTMGGSSSPDAVVTTGALSGKILKSKISAGFRHSCAIASDNLAYCWGYNNSGQVGEGSIGGNRSVPYKVVNTGVLSSKSIKTISAGGSHTCAVASDNRVYCWGLNSSGQLGDGTGSTTASPVAVDVSGVLSGASISKVSSGNNHTCALSSSGQVYCWGSGYSTTPSLLDLSNLGGKTVKSISAGGSHTCLISSDDKLYCWGTNTNGQLGDGTTTARATPVVINGGGLSGKTVKAVMAAYAHTCAIASDNKPYCWGYNNYNQLGDGTNTQRTSPVAVNAVP